MTTQPTAPNRVPRGATPEGDGVIVGNGPVRIDAYIDFQCPYCRQFELSSRPTLAALVANSEANIAYHPMNFLDEASTTNYSTRAAAASGCAADQDRFFEYGHVLFVHQPPEGGPGLSDVELAALGVQAELSGPAFGNCLADGSYLVWPSYVTDRAVALRVAATPTVLVAGEVVRARPETITAAVARARAKP
jgi:protein-disulfide isomerase